MTALINGAPTIQRAAILAAIKALAYSIRRMSGIVQQDNYPAGYQDGFQDALTAVALMLGSDELGGPGVVEVSR